MGNCGSDPQGALSVLAEVLRRARQLWPLQEDAGDDTVTLRIDAIKELEVHALEQVQPGEAWTLQRTSNVDARVVKSNWTRDTPDSSTTYLLHFGKARNDEQLPVGAPPYFRYDSAHTLESEMSESPAELPQPVEDSDGDNPCVLSEHLVQQRKMKQNGDGQP